MIEDGWPIHHVKEMLGHASVEQTKRYLNIKLRGLHESMDKYDRSRPACRAVAGEALSEPRTACNEAPAQDENLLILRAGSRPQQPEGAVQRVRAEVVVLLRAAAGEFGSSRRYGGQPSRVLGSPAVAHLRNEASRKVSERGPPSQRSG